MISEQSKDALAQFADSIPTEDESSRAQTIKAIAERWKHPEHFSGRTSGWVAHPSRAGYLKTIADIEVHVNAPSVIIAPNRYVMKQIEETLTASGTALDDIGTYHAQATQSQKKAALGKKILITTPSIFSSLVRKEAISADPENPNFRPLVFFDGIHKGKSEKIKPQLKPFIEKATVIGFASQEKLSNGQTIGDVLFDGAPAIHSTDLQTSVNKSESAQTKCIVLESSHNPGVRVEGNRDYTEAERNAFLSPLRTRIAVSRMHKEYVDKETGMALRICRPLSIAMV
jgi:hypothetical protein